MFKDHGLESSLVTALHSQNRFGAVPGCRWPASAAFCESLHGLRAKSTYHPRRVAIDHLSLAGPSALSFVTKMAFLKLQKSRSCVFSAERKLIFQSLHLLRGLPSLKEWCSNKKSVTQSIGSTEHFSHFFLREVGGGGCQRKPKNFKDSHLQKVKEQRKQIR